MARCSMTNVDRSDLLTMSKKEENVRLNALMTHVDSSEVISKLSAMAGIVENNAVLLTASRN